MISYSTQELNRLEEDRLVMSKLCRESNSDIMDHIFSSNNISSFYEGFDFPIENKFKLKSQQNSNEFFSSPITNRSTVFSEDEIIDNSDASIPFNPIHDETLFQSRNSEQKRFYEVSEENINTPKTLSLNDEPEVPYLLQVRESHYSCSDSFNQSFFNSALKEKKTEINLKNKKHQKLLNKKTSRTEILSSNSTIDSNEEHKSASSKIKKQRRNSNELIKAEEEKTFRPILSSIYLDKHDFPLLNPELLNQIALQFYTKNELNHTQEEKEIEETEEEKTLLVSPRMKFADSIYKKINIYFIRIPLIELSKYLIDSNPNYQKKEKTANKKKLMLANLSKDVTIEALKDLHQKTLSEIFTIDCFTSQAVIDRKKDETDEQFEKRKENYLLKKEKKRIVSEKILSEITQLPVFEEIAGVRVNEIYNQIAENENLKETILKYLAIKYPDPDYLKMFEAIIEERKRTFELKGNENHQDKQ